MRPDVASVVRGADIRRWKPVRLECGDQRIEVLLPPDAKTLGMREFAPLSRPREEVRRSLDAPIGSPPLPQILGAKGKPARDLSVCSAFLPEPEQRLIPGTAGWDFLPHRIFPGDGEATRAMVQNALIHAYHHPKWKGRVPSVAFIREGPYAVPFLRPPANGK